MFPSSTASIVFLHLPKCHFSLDLQSKIFWIYFKMTTKKMFFLGEHIAVQYTIKKELMAL